MSVFEPVVVDQRSKVERVADLIEQRIRSGQFGPGARLGTKAELQASFAVAVGTMDAALRVLADRGLVVVRPGAKGGVAVADGDGFLAMAQGRWRLRNTDRDDPTAQREAASTALALEPLIVAEAVANATEDDRAALVAASEAFLALTDVDGYQVHHRRLHTCVLAATHNALLATLVPGLWARVLEDGAPVEPPAGAGARWFKTRARLHARLAGNIIAGDLAQALITLHDHGATGHDLDGEGLTAGYRALWRHHNHP